MAFEPQPEHKWLEQLVGDWTYEVESDFGPDERPYKMNGADRTRSLGGAWVLSEWDNETSEGEMSRSIMTLGYDPEKQAFVGTFVSSMMASLWVYEGQLDAAGKVLTLETEGPGFTPDVPRTKYRDVIEIVDDDRRVLSSHALGADGAWTTFMTMRFTRAK